VVHFGSVTTPVIYWMTLAKDDDDDAYDSDDDDDNDFRLKSTS